MDTVSNSRIIMIKIIKVNNTKKEIRKEIQFQLWSEVCYNSVLMYSKVLLKGSTVDHPSWGFEPTIFQLPPQIYYITPTVLLSTVLHI